MQVALKPIPKQNVWLQSLGKALLIKALPAAVLGFLYTFMMAYIIYGSLRYPVDHLIFDLIYSFTYFFLLQEGYRRLSRVMRRKYFRNPFRIRRYLTEFFLFVVISIVLFTLVGLLPFLLLFDSFVNPEFAATEIRINYIVNVLVISLYYGLVTAYQFLKSYHQSRIKTEKLQKEIAQAKYESLKNQVNPHFLFNSLNVLSALISLDTDLAEKFTAQLSKVYRYVLEHKEEDLVALKTEVEFIQAYLFLLNIRFKDKLFVEVKVPEEVQEETQIPPLSLQLLIENAIKHNAFTRSSPLYIKIFVSNDFYLHVVNNLQHLPEKPVSTGMGLLNIRKRYQYLTTRHTRFGVDGEKYVAQLPLL